MMTMELLEKNTGMENETESANVENGSNTEEKLNTAAEKEQEAQDGKQEPPNPDLPALVDLQCEGPLPAHVEDDQPEALKPAHVEDDQCEAPQPVLAKQEPVLNLNNEVVRMRKEVKRVRTLIIRKLTRQIGALKKKKGKDADLERNKRRASRLLEEIHAIKTLVPDLVTKTALQKTLNFEQACKDPKSTISDRAMARIGTHPQFSKKIEAIKAAVKAFKEERTDELKSGLKVPKRVDKAKKPPLSSNPDKESHVVDKNVALIQSKSCEMNIKTACHDEPGPGFPKVKVQQKVNLKKTQTENTNNKPSSVKNVFKYKQVDLSVESKDTKVPPKATLEAESDVALSESDEKEYFDDSTEERFLKQSSGDSEESDNDFFVGKVNRFKKNKRTKPIEDKTVHKTLGNDSNPLPNSKVQSELDELESRLKSKPTMKSVFCSSLSGPKTGKGAGKGDRKFPGQDRRKDGANRDFSKQTKEKPERSDFKHRNPYSGEKTFGKKSAQFGGRGGQREVEHKRPKDARGGSMFTHQAPQQALHPSWEASKKRKEQQGQILAFQGKKIKFDD
ncbi:unnamed protein product [Knipowitschia caucasica]